MKLFQRHQEKVDEVANDPNSIERRAANLLLKNQRITLTAAAKELDCSERQAMRLLVRMEKAGRKNPDLPTITHRVEDGEVVFVVESGGLNRAQRRAMR